MGKKNRVFFIESHPMRIIKTNFGRQLLVSWPLGRFVPQVPGPKKITWPIPPPPPRKNTLICTSDGPLRKPPYPPPPPPPKGTRCHSMQTTCCLSFQDLLIFFGPIICTMYNATFGPPPTDATVPLNKNINCINWHC
jgi:hypothetical protein